MLLGKSLKLPTSTLKKVHDVLPLLLKVLKKKACQVENLLKGDLGKIQGIKNSQGRKPLKAAQAKVRAKKKPFELRGDLIPLKGYVGSLVFYSKFSHVSNQNLLNYVVIPLKGYVGSLVFHTKFNHMLKQKPFELCHGFEPLSRSL